MTFFDLIMFSQLANPVPTNAFDGKLLLELIGIGLLVLQLLVSFKVLSRKPSIDVDLTQLQGTLTRMEGDMKGVKGRLDEGDTIMTQLQVNQGVNGEAVRNMKSDVHEIKTQVNTILSRITGGRKV